MPEKPTNVSTWATDGGTRVEPTVGEKAAGFAVDDRPPARWINFLWGLLSDWIAYLNAPIGTGAAGSIEGTGGSTSGPGFKGTGGAPNGHGYEGNGTGSGSGVKGTGGDTSGARGIHGVGGSTNGVGVRGDGTGTGDAMVGVGVDGHGMVAQSDPSSPQRSAFRIVGQNDFPTVESAGSVLFLDAASALYFHDDIRTVWRPFNPAIFRIVADEQETANLTEFASTAITIDEHLLAAGTVIRVRAAGTIEWTSGSGTAQLEIVFGDSTSPLLGAVGIGSDTNWDAEWLFTIRGAGTDVDLQMAMRGVMDGGLKNTTLISSVFDTNADQTLTLRTGGTFSNIDGITVNQFVVEVL